MTEELKNHMNDLQFILELKELLFKSDQLNFELKYKVSYTTKEPLSEESLNELPNRIKEIEEELSEHYKKSIRIMKDIENNKNFTRLIEILKNDPILVKKILNEIDKGNLNEKVSV